MEGWGKSCIDPSLDFFFSLFLPQMPRPSLLSRRLISSPSRALAVPSPLGPVTPTLPGCRPTGCPGGGLWGRPPPDSNQRWKRTAADQMAPCEPSEWFSSSRTEISLFSCLCERIQTNPGAKRGRFSHTCFGRSTVPLLLSVEGKK